MIDVTQAPKGAFNAAVAEAAPGDAILYHIGEFAGGTHRTAAYTAYETGKVILVQKRDAPRRFMFIAIRTKDK